MAEERVENMGKNQQEMYHELIDRAEHLTEFEAKYWKLFSDPGTWEFWLILMMLVVPLVVLYFAMDRRKILLLGFYGFNIHCWFQYIDATGARLGWWGYPYHMVPYVANFALDASLVPVTFMLVYQWTINHKKNYYLYTFLTSAIFAFILKPIMVWADLFTLEDGLRFVDLFMLYCIVFFISRMITSFFLFLGKKQEAF